MYKIVKCINSHLAKIGQLHIICVNHKYFFAIKRINAVK